MVLDPKLRDVLDFLPCEPCLERPSPDQEVLCTICHRLNRTVALKCQVSLVDHDPLAAPSEAELEAAREEARLKQEEFEDLRAQQEADTGAVDQLRAERDALLARQQELEDRLTALEAQSHGGHITFVDDAPSEPVDEVVEFARVDLGSEDDLMEFESLGSAPGFAGPDPGAWEDAAWDEAAPLGEEEAPWQEDAPDWEDAEAEPATARGPVAWDDSEPAAAPTYGEEEEAPWETVDEPTDWSGTHAKEEGRAHAETEEVDNDLDLDDRTRADLSELEAQLEELERELAKKKTRDPDEE